MCDLNPTELASAKIKRIAKQHSVTVDIQTTNAVISTFIDFEQAFDSLQHENMWKVMAKYGIPVKIINLIKNMYEGYSCQVIHYGKLTHSL